jgi:hypothetical protein
MVILSHVGYFKMRFKVSENGTELIVTMTYKFNSATPFFDSEIQTIQDLMNDPQSKILSAMFNHPPSAMTYTIKLGKAVGTNPVKRPFKRPDGSTFRTIIILTVRNYDDDAADSMESL